MESCGNDVSSDSSDSSTTDSSSNESTPAHASVPTAIDLRNTSSETMKVPENEDSESDSDVSMSADSDSEEDEPQKMVAMQVNPMTQRVQPDLDSINTPTVKGTKKRKFSSSTEPINHNVHNGIIFEDRKRLRPIEEHEDQADPNNRTRKDKSTLPAEIWMYIFTFCPPTVLGQLLQINKSFHNYLEPSPSNNSVVALPKSLLKLMKVDEIWRASRKRFLHASPGPLSGKSELDMWKIACGPSCQFCSKKGTTDSKISQDQWHPGPGEYGIGPVWPFGILTCGSCLKKRSIKEIDLLLSSSIPSPLMAALPFVILTAELHVISPATLQTSHHPQTMQFTKYFFSPHVEDIKKEFEDVKALGSAAAEEWLKGLDGVGKERMNDAARWERWEGSGGLTKMRNMNLEIAKPISQPENTLPTKLQGHPQTDGSLPPSFNLAPPAHQRPAQPTPSLPLYAQNNYLANAPPRFDSPSQHGFNLHPPRPTPQARHERTKEEVAELKAARRVEIERRCMLLDPPLTAGVLAHMASFQAAIQIIQPLSDSAWEVLKPRLLSQREEAEHRESDRLAQTRVVQERSDNRYLESQSRSDSKDFIDKEWEDIQAPLRARIGGYADEIIRDGWSAGDKVSYETSPLFAAEVLIYVRKRFYAEIAKDEAALRASGREPDQDPPNGPYTRKLILENMKWVFDTKIKPHTEPHRKELFLCAACEFITKYYGFEGVIQHYAAKHTSALSMGSIVVHWKSEWPEDPPFSPEPNNFKPYFGAAPNANVPYTSNAPPPAQQTYGYGGYQQAPVSAPMLAPTLHGYQESPGPYYGHPQFEQYSGEQTGPYAPPQYPDGSQGYQNQQYSVAPQIGHIAGYNDAPVDYQQGYNGQYQAPPQHMYSSQSQTFSAPHQEHHPQQATYVPQNAAHEQSYNQSTQFSATNYPPERPQVTEEYKAQLLELARIARDIWTSIQGVKDVPGSVKVYTTIFHILKRFREMFQDDPPLSMLVDGLSNNKDMRPVRNVNGLVCRACSLGMAGSKSASNKKHLSFPQLVNHFYSVHEGATQGSSATSPDWTQYMVELPDSSKLASISSARGMDDQKLSIFAEALPGIVASVSNRADPHRGPENQYAQINQEQDYMELAPSRDNHADYYTTADDGGNVGAGAATYEAGEYDPRHPRESLVESHSYHQPSYTQGGQPNTPSERERVYTYPSKEDDHYNSYREVPERLFVGKRPLPDSLQSRNRANAERMIIHEEESLYTDRPLRDRDLDNIEYRARRERPLVRYDEPEVVYQTRDYKVANSQAYRSNGEDLPVSQIQHTQSRDSRIQPPAETSQQNRIYEVVAQIGHQAKEAQEQQHARNGPLDVGSEDGEVRPEYRPKSNSMRPVPQETRSDAERFLDDFNPGGATRATPIGAGGTDRRADFRPTFEREREPVYQPASEFRGRGQYEEERNIPSERLPPTIDDHPRNGHNVIDRGPPRQTPYSYEERYATSAPDQPYQRDRSPELLERRYKPSIVYRDERQASTHRTPSRYARYESVRLENERNRSKSPYVKMGPQPGQYHERSPLPLEPIYRSRTPQAAEDVSYDKPPPRQEYYRIYADEPRVREQPVTEAFEYVRVADPQGDYMIRRPVRRQVEPIYARYEDDGYGSQPVYESRPAPIPRQRPVYYAEEDEYDPRHPEPIPPPLATPVRQGRY